MTKHITLILIGLCLWSSTTALAREKLEGEDSQWEISPTTPRYASVVIRFEDPARKLWPTYIVARSVSESLLTMKFSDADNLVPQGSFTAKAIDASLVFSKRHARVLEPYQTGPEAPDVSVYLQMDDTQVQRVHTTDAQGRERVELRWNATGRLMVGPHTVPLQGHFERRFRRTNNKPYVAISFETQIDGRRIGLDIEMVRVVVEALASEPDGGKPKR